MANTARPPHTILRRPAVQVRTGLSRSTLYRHIASINKKVEVTSRVALINYFWSWTPQD
mgnify:CR=1 FL=1